jgi:hypothetical protein
MPFAKKTPVARKTYIFRTDFAVARRVDDSPTMYYLDLANGKFSHERAAIEVNDAVADIAYRIDNDRPSTRND